MFMLAKWKLLPSRLLDCQDKLPLYIACQFGTAHQRPWHHKGKKKVHIYLDEHEEPGDGVSIDQIGLLNLVSFHKYQAF